MSENENTIFENQMGTQLRLGQPGTYRICIKGELSKGWSDRLDGLDISSQSQEDGSVITALEGKLLDQTALMGVLVTLYNLGLPLISVEFLVSAEKEENDLLKVDVKQKDAYIEFIVTGTYDLKNAIEKFPLVITASQQTGISKALIDYRGLVGEAMLTQELMYAHHIGEYHQEYLASGGQPLKIAFVGNETLPQNVTEAIGKTYGLELIVTSDYQEAVNWLRNEN